jgi:putative SOS response-associated peptidase YedK
VHDRMPVILKARDYARWFSRDAAERLPVDLLRAFAVEEMTMGPADGESLEGAEEPDSF